MNVLLSQFSNFQSWKEKRGEEEEGGAAEGKG